MAKRTLAMPTIAPAPSIPTTLGALVNAEAALGRLLVLPLPVKTAYHLAKLARLVAVETAHFTGQRNAAIRTFGADREPTESERQAGNTTVCEVTPAHLPAFHARLQELAALDVTIAWAPLSLDALGEIAITGDDLLALEPLVVA